MGPPTCQTVGRIKSQRLGRVQQRLKKQRLSPCSQVIVKNTGDDALIGRAWGTTEHPSVVLRHHSKILDASYFSKLF